MTAIGLLVCPFAPNLWFTLTGMVQFEYPHASAQDPFPKGIIPCCWLGSLLTMFYMPTVDYVCTRIKDRFFDLGANAEVGLLVGGYHLIPARTSSKSPFSL